MKKKYDIGCRLYDWFADYTSYTIHHTSRLSVLLVVVSLSGCFSSKHLRNNEYLLTAQTIRGNRAITSEKLESLIPQKPNRRILGLPITPPLWFYQLGQKRFDREAALRDLQAKTNEFEQQSQLLANQPDALKKLNRRFGHQIKKLRLRAEEGNWVMRNLGEPPSYFAERDAQTNATKMQKYLSDKGFFHANATYKLDTLRHRQIRVDYLITEKTGFYLKNITYEIADPHIDSVIRQSIEESKLKSGNRFDFDDLSGEKVRIESLLRDRGYYTFSRQYIRATDVDSTRRYPGDSLHRQPGCLPANPEPTGRSSHPVYRVGDIEVQISPAAKSTRG